MEQNNSNIQLIHAPITMLERLKAWLMFHLIISGAALNGILFKTYILPAIKEALK